MLIDLGARLCISPNRNLRIDSRELNRCAGRGSQGSQGPKHPAKGPPCPQHGVSGLASGNAGCPCTESRGDRVKVTDMKGPGSSLHPVRQARRHQPGARIDRAVDALADRCSQPGPIHCRFPFVERERPTAGREERVGSRHGLREEPRPSGGSEDGGRAEVCGRVKRVAFLRSPAFSRGPLRTGGNPHPPLAGRGHRRPWLHYSASRIRNEARKLDTRKRDRGMAEGLPCR